MKKFNDADYIARCGNRLSLALEALGITATELQKAGGFTQSQVSNWLTGRQRVSLDAAIIIEDLYEVPMSYIFRASLSQLDLKVRKFVTSESTENWER